MLAVTGLDVVFGASEKAKAASGKYQDDGELGWRIYLVVHDLVIPMKFARERDARAAMAAIVDAADWVGPIERLADLKYTDLAERMLGALQW